MDSHTLKVLEYGKILERLAAHASNSMGREAAYALTPSVHPEIVSRRLQETREARHLLDSDSGLPLGGIHDIRTLVEQAAKGMGLAPPELLDVGETVASARRMKQYLAKRAEHCPLLGEIGGNLPPLPSIETRIGECISEGGDIRDSATPELARVRSQLRVSQNRLRDKLNNILASEKYRTFIQESIITMREGRYCVPVKAENKAALGGIVHDASASGATVFIEPGACVELGNEVRELQIKEEQEVFRILRTLTELVGKSADELRATLELLSNLDLANAKALLADEMQAAEPHLTRDGVIRLADARHPLLTGSVVPISIEIGDRFTILLITGPNTGGKTVTLKTVGLLALMAQSGLQIPASPDSRMSIFDQVFSDIGDEQDIQQSLSTFSAHLRNITRIIQAIPVPSENGAVCKSTDTRGQPKTHTLILVDELGAGTDPAEGAALAKALLQTFQARDARVIATTHYGELKEYAYAHAGVENASVEFDRESLRPTYRVLLGVPGSSNAFYIAERLGLSEEIVSVARGYLSSRDQSTADLLQQIEESRRKTFEMEREAEIAKRQAEASRQEYEERVREVSDIQRSARRQAEEEARTVLRRVSEKAENILDELRRKNRGSRKGSTARKQISELRSEVSSELSPEEPEIHEPIPAGGFTFHRGDRVRVTSFGLDGELLEEPKDGTVAVQMGALRATLPLDVLRPARSPKPEPKKRTTTASDMSMRKAIHISPELNLRAMRVEEAAPLLDKYMDDAFAAGIHNARIVHGKGTGALRKFVWETLNTHPVVESLKLGDDAEGGDGVTLVTFKE